MPLIGHACSHPVLPVPQSRDSIRANLVDLQERLWKQAAAMAIAYEVARMRGKWQGWLCCYSRVGLSTCSLHVQLDSVWR